MSGTLSNGGFLIFTLKTCSHRPTQDKLTQFVDLASITNVSTLALDSKLHGYYIHGRSPHGFADVDMKALITNLKKVSVVSSGSVNYLACFPQLQHCSTSFIWLAYFYFVGRVRHCRTTWAGAWHRPTDV